MSLPVVFRPEARAELAATSDWHEHQAGLGAEFIAAVDEVLELFAANPKLYQAVYRDVRRAVVRRFPYNVFYREEPGQVLVIAVVHGRRDPSIWRSRT